MIKKIFPFVLALLVAAGVGIVFSLLWGQSEQSKEATKNIQRAELPKPQKIGSPLLIRGLTYTSYGEYGLAKILEAESFEVRKRRFWAINIKSINEAILINSRLSIFSHLHREPNGDLIDLDNALSIGDFDDQLVRSKMLGRVTRLLADKITIELYRDDQKIVVLKAAAALIEKKKEGAKFFDAVLQDVRSNRFLEARTILWDINRKVFVIPGVYRDIGSLGQISGKSVEVDMNFKVSPYDRLSDPGG